MELFNFYFSSVFLKKYRFFIIKVLVSFAFFQGFFWGSVFAAETGKPLGVSPLPLAQLELWLQTQNFFIGSLSLKSILKGDLKSEHISFIETQILNYTQELQKVSFGISEDYKKTILQLQQDFFISLLPYIETSKIQDFKTVVSQEAITFEKSTVIGTSADIPPKSDATLLIETQVQKNNELIRSQMQEGVLDQIRVKLDAIVTQEKFQSLPADIKKDMFQKLSDKLAVKLQELQKVPNATRIIEEKVFLYHAILELLQSYIESWEA